MKGRRRREEEGGGASPVLRHNLPHYTTSKDTVSSVNCTLSSLTAYLHQSSVQKNRKKKIFIAAPSALSAKQTPGGREGSTSRLPPPADPPGLSSTAAVRLS